MHKSAVPNSKRLKECNECERDYLQLKGNTCGTCPSCQIEDGEREVRMRQNPER